MRELKFRAWNIKTLEYNKYVELYCYMDGSFGCSASNENNVPVGNSDKFIIEQFTGRKDMRGTPIYEGDTIKIVTISDKIREVGFSSGSFVIKYEGLNFSIINPIKDYNADELEVIGNIHETQEGKKVL